MIYAILLALMMGGVWIGCRFKYIHPERFPKKGPYLICPNHVRGIDPFYMALLAWPRKMHFLGKEELFKNKLYSAILHWIGVYPVGGGGSDLKALQFAMKMLRKGERVLIFPEGRRVHPGEPDETPHSGPAMLAIREHVPVLPVYIERRKKGFRRVIVHVGEPLDLTVEGRKPTREDFDRGAEEIMRAVRAMRPAEDK